MKDEINKVLNEYSDFSFEMKVLKIVNDFRYKTEHSGTYLDAYTKQNREFDIRARKQIAKDKFIKLSIECKNISLESPLIIHSVPAKKSDLNHSLIIGFRGARQEDEKRHSYKVAIHAMNPTPPMISYVVNHRMDHNKNIYESIYSHFRFIGKSLDKVKTKNKGTKTETKILDDSEIYPKYSQAINSLVDLILETEKDTLLSSQTLILPIFIVPDGTLWSVTYNTDGSRQGDPTQVNRIPLHIHKIFGEQELGKAFPQFTVFFLEIVTESGPKALLPKLEGDEDYEYSPSFISNAEMIEVVKTELMKS